MINGKTALYGILGHPVGHSRSPAMQNAAFAEVGLDAVYVPLPVAPERLAEGVAGAHALGFHGLNVTVPHKEAVVPLCGTVDAVAKEFGAVNTLRRTPRGWEGFNTDAPACLALLEAAGVGHGARALLVGSGGAARAGAWALARLGAMVRVDGPLSVRRGFTPGELRALSDREGLGLTVELSFPGRVVIRVPPGSRE